MANAINYVNCMLIDFASENDLELYLKSRDEIMTSEMYRRLTEAGIKRQVVSKVLDLGHNLSLKSRLSETAIYFGRHYFITRL